MKKIMLPCLIAAMGAGAANAGIFDFLGKKSEPAAIEEACGEKEIAKFCPEDKLEGKTLSECLMKNSENLSKNCKEFVNKNVVVAEKQDLGKEKCDKAANGEKSGCKDEKNKMKKQDEKIGDNVKIATEI